jgi:integrase
MKPIRGHGRIFRRGSVWWVAYYHRGREYRESTRSELERDARRLLRERLRVAGTPQFIGPSADKLTFEDLADGYLTDYRINAKRSIRDAERAVRWLRQTFSLNRALDITSDRIAAYVDSRLAEKVKPATVNRELAALRRMFSLAVKSGKLASRPHVAMLEEQNAREGFFDAADFEEVRSQLQADLGDFAAFAFLTGWRKGEVQTLSWADVDRKASVIRLRAVHSKNKRGRVLVLRGELQQLIEKRHELRRPDCPFVFHRDGVPIGDIRKAWATACRSAGFEGRLFHDLRRSAVRNFVRAGVSERVAMAMSGHQTRSVFDRYNIVSEDDLADAAERTAAYVERERNKSEKVVPLRRAANEG